MIDVLAAVPARRGHFLLESGYHSDLWLTLDALFTDPATTDPLVLSLSEKLRPHAVAAVCGPLVGGAFLAQALGRVLGTACYYTEPGSTIAGAGLFKAAYRLPPELRRRVRGQRVAVVDDVISAGSAVRATIAALTAAQASPVVVGSLLILGDIAVAHFAVQHMPLVFLGHREFRAWNPAECPLCQTQVALEDPQHT